ncbi:BTAD domain-containing putative transcriptional regulator [Dactylosporangium sucinum]|uniref:OmpR/PhoB-type domain-containing protein n=1 Tax=Dactylosporangium sucinum TaxID=1424081 RepID=A0A917WXU3_9ACTN|nr:BTAD domain-containing putative transcriptional regulator [Dactylosporangium sucinum]GGM38660.1 hypothetical protein GCM10007977_045140 [Dactylosporangium sucinum]
MSLQIGALGPLRASLGGAALDLGGPRQRAVLARLVAAGGHVVPADRFVDDLWQGEPPPKAMAALQVYVSNLRRVLEPGRAPRTPARVVVSAAPGYALRLPAAAVDAWHFEDLLRRAAPLAAGDPAAADALLQEALAVWAGPAYAEFRDEPWAVPEAARLEELRLVCVETAGQVALRLGRAALAVPELERHVQAHPLREQAVALLATALYRAGRQADALAALRAARERLADELGVDPGPALRAIEADVLAHADHLSSPVPEALPERQAVEPGPDVAVGRDDELDRLGREADAAERHGLRVVWVGGEAGAGKTTLLRMFAARAAGRGWRVLWGRCPEVDGAPPAWAWTEILGVVEASFELAQAATERLGDGGPLLVVLDDVHRADGETLQVLRHVAVALAGRPVLVAATHRPGEGGAALAAARAALAGPRSAELELAGLGAGDAARLLRSHLGDDLDPDTAAVVHARTGGNPLFLAETARLISAEGAASAVQAIPSGIGHVLRRRLSRLPAPAQTVLRQAAVVGRDVDVDVLEAAVGSASDADDTVLDGLEAGVLAGLLEEPAPGQVRFTHALLRELLYADMPLLRRRRLHERVLATLERVRPADAAALAHHALASVSAATAARTAGHAAAAARQAAALHAHDEAATLWSGALDALGRLDAPDPSVRLDLLCGLVSARAHAGDMTGARAARAEAVAAARALGAPAALHRALTAFDAPVAWSIRPARVVDAPLVALLEAALAADPPPPPDVRCRLLVSLVYELEGDDTTRCADASAEAVALAGDDWALRCQALNARYFAVLNPQRRHELPAVGAELLDVAGRAGLPGFQAQAHHVLFQAALERNDFAAAQSHIDEALHRSTAGQLGITLSVLSILGAIRALFAGDFATAERLYLELVDRIERAGQPNAAEVGLLGVFFVRLAQHAAHTMLPQLEPIATIAPGEANDMITRALVDAGRLDEARAVWAPDAIAVRADYYWLTWMGLRAENAAALGDAAWSARCYEALLPWAGQFVGLASGTIGGPPVDLVLGRLATTLGDPAAAGRHFAAARALADSVGAAHWAAEAAGPR